MKVRMLAPNKQYLATMTMSVAFEGNFDYEKEKESAATMTPEEIEEKLHPKAEGEPPLPSDGIPVKYWAALSDDEIVAYSAMKIFTFPARFAGETVLMGGVGGVATLPPHRKKGGVRACITAALRDMYESGYLLSSLYPFNSAYYRQFGYEKGAPIHIWTIPLEKIRAREMGGTIRQLLPEDSLKPLADIYNDCYRDYNVSVIRRVFDKDLNLAALFNKQKYIYIWENDKGVPDGFMITHKNQIDGQPVLDCGTSFHNNCGMLFRSPEAFRAMMSFAKSAFSSDYRAIRFLSPDALFMDALIDEGSSARCEQRWNGMLRVVNVEKALKLCRCNGTGSLKLSITDEQLPENSGCWKIDFAPGKPNSVTKTMERPDISMPISDFSALICGVRSGSDLEWMPDVVVHRPDAPLVEVFYKQKCFFLDLF